MLLSLLLHSLHVILLDNKAVRFFLLHKILPFPPPPLPFPSLLVPSFPIPIGSSSFFIPSPPSSTYLRGLRVGTVMRNSPLSSSSRNLFSAFILNFDLNNNNNNNFFLALSKRRQSECICSWLSLARRVVIPAVVVVVVMMDKGNRRRFNCATIPFSRPFLLLD